MKKSLFLTAVFAFLTLGFWSCSHNSPSSPSNPTPTPTSSGPQTITVNIVSGGPNSFEYQSAGITNLVNGGLNLAAHVGGTISLPAGGFHTLYFDPGSATCIFNDATAATQTYTFTAAGTYYF